MARPEYINDDDAVINLSEFKQSSNQRKFRNPVPIPSHRSDQSIYVLFSISAGTAPLCYLGLEHVNKTQRRSRFTYLEKAIKIYN